MASSNLLGLLVVLLATMLTSVMTEDTHTVPTFQYPCHGHGGGYPGPAGPAGPPGSPGTTGPSGVPGVQGPQGMTGPIGNRGEAGRDGDKGFKGEKGEAGLAGLQGPIGDRGLTGKDGEIGVKGDRGSTGHDGTKGSMGEEGHKGSKGVPGEEGTSGLKGQPGVKGSEGESGPKGDKGDQGLAGEPGKGGTPGEKGEPGLTAPAQPVTMFTARITKRVNLDSGSRTLTFDGEELNIGDDFDRHTGIFKCRIQGVYLFTFNVWNYASQAIDIRLMHNGSSKARAYSTTAGYTTVGQTVVIALDVDDEISLLATAPTDINASSLGENIFSGYLLQATSDKL